MAIRAPMRLRAALFAAVLLAPLPEAAFAHATFETAEAKAGTSYKAVLRVPHGCEGAATHTVRVSLPEGLYAVKPMPKPGWTLSTKTGPYKTAFDNHGKPMTEGVVEITWSGGNLPDAHYDEFVFRGSVGPALAAGDLFVPVVQECEKGQVAWIETPKPGQKAHDLKFPAPAIRILASDKSAHSGHGGTAEGAAPVTLAADKVIAAGALKIERVWTRATPPGAKVAGGFMRITNTGTEPDRLIGGEFSVAGVFEVHEMKVENGVMSMRPLDKGLLIAPGQTVELKPGGYHVMFMDLKQPIAQGATISGTLTFEKAGKVAVSFEAAGIGAPGPAEHKH